MSGYTGVMAAPWPVLPVRPQKRMTNPHVDACEEKGMAEHTATLLNALDEDIASLATKVWNISNSNMRLKSAPFLSKDVSIPRIVNTILQFTPELLHAIIEGKLHLTLDTNSPQRPSFKLPRDHRIAVAGHKGGQQRPVIYAMVHCTKSGKTPSKRQYKQILRKMEVYVSDYQHSVGWADADRLADLIDKISPSNIPRCSSDRDWTGRLRGKGYEEWHDGFDHPRRYAFRNGTAEKIHTFINNFNERLDEIPATKENEPIPCSLAYIGWTRTEHGREKQHYAHSDTASQLKFLLEATTLHLYHSEGFLMHFQPILNVLDASDARWAEHTCSILAGSYNFWGGLNGAIAGPQSVETTLNKEPRDELWKNGVRSLIKQGVYTPNAEALREDLEVNEFFQRYKDKGSEIRDLVPARISHETSSKGMEMALGKVETTYAAYAYTKTKVLEKLKEVDEARMSLGILQALNKSLGG